jgi:predicted phage-related endonuclease
MDPPSELEKENAALLAERETLKRRVAELTARRAELERRLTENASEQAATAVGPHQATDLECAPPANGQTDPGDCD